MGTQSYFTITETATRVASYQWVEEKLFELLGGWVLDIDNPEATYVVGTQSYHHEFMAQLWADRLPQLTQGGSTTPPREPPDERLAQILSPDYWSDHTGLVKLALLYRTLLPRMVGSYREHITKADPRTDGATHRTLELCLRDYRSDWMNGEHLVQSLAAEVDNTDEIFEAGRRLDSLLAGRFGLLTTVM